MPSGLGKVNVIYSLTSQFSRKALSEESLMSKTKLISKVFHFDNPTKLTGGLSTWGRRKRQIHSRQGPVCSHWSHSGWPLALPERRLWGAQSALADVSPGGKEGACPGGRVSATTLGRGEGLPHPPWSPPVSLLNISAGILPSFPASLRYAVRKWCPEGLQCWQQLWFLWGFRREQYQTLSRQIFKNSEYVSPLFSLLSAHYAPLWAYLVNYMNHVLLPLSTSEAFCRLEM